MFNLFSSYESNIEQLDEVAKAFYEELRELLPRVEVGNYWYDWLARQNEERHEYFRLKVFRMQRTLKIDLIHVFRAYECAIILSSLRCYLAARTNEILPI